MQVLAFVHDLNKYCCKVVVYHCSAEFENFNPARFWEYETEIYRLTKSLEICKDNNRNIKRAYSGKVAHLQRRLNQLDQQHCSNQQVLEGNIFRGSNRLLAYFIFCHIIIVIKLGHDKSRSTCSLLMRCSVCRKECTSRCTATGFL